jgi:Domain of unknown function (DUF4402)
VIKIPIILFRRKKIHLFFYVSMLLCGCSFSVKAQPPPPRPISIYVNPAQGLIFGAFFQGASGGTVIVYPDGSRTVTGSLVLANLGYPYSPAIFEVDANVGTAVSIMNGPDVTLTGSNGGSVSLHIGTASTGSSFVTTAISPSRTQVRIGGTLTVGNPLANPSGNYSGTFSVTFIQQ